MTDMTKMDTIATTIVLYFGAVTAGWGGGIVEDPMRDWIYRDFISLWN